ncbi:unnamed protein product [Aphanomyces euteiches]|uniref:Guanine nucleotide-binding protein-like 1 n=1 Tax=Aphanomyces euteiches TaxID=100861 RepID=A0A6G0X8X0_9STRA|nr:hypothetical protein Ae201684_007528 [Aphanomyces euteiches]KAH9100717.1 hypothetical protein Ae201684P_006911 [Aphanomyces euteiches]KAH9132064.1 hypothetical protein AeRB84_021426 [Aphanomyces euteiches]
MPGKPFSGKQKKLQLQAKRERKAQKEAAQERDANAPPAATAAPDVSTDVGYSGDLKTIFAKESQEAINARKRDATRSLIMAPDRGNSQSIYNFGIANVDNQPTIPLRPSWTTSMTPEELNEREENSFREWLTQIHQACINRKDGLQINSYERNLQVWRQLWRVVEKANILVHLADSRCPLLHLSHRLIQHIQKHYPDKRLLILLTKSDFVASEREAAWVHYIHARYSVPVLSYSCNRALESNGTLLQTLGELSRGLELEDSSNIPMIGLVGEPNVGKSSFLNSMFLKKKVSVSSTPGHTKHFQTHFYDNPHGIDGVDKLCFCDCPGVVFPRFGVPLALQILFGSFPIAQTREPYSAIRFLAENADPTIQEVYKLRKVEEEDDWSPYTIAEAYANLRGFHVKGGKLDVFRAANTLLRDTLNGKKVVLSFPPPTSDPCFVETKKDQLDGSTTDDI